MSTHKTPRPWRSAFSWLTAPLRAPKATRQGRRRHRPRLALEELETRVVPTNQAIVFFINGFSGAQIPTAVRDHLVNDLIQQSSIPQANWRVYETNWNSTDPTTTSDFPGGFFGTDTGFGFSAALINQVVFGVPIPYGITVDPIVTPDPVTPVQFVDNVSNLLDTQYDDADFVALIGHSLGGDAALRIANQTHRQIDLLATLDPVGWTRNPDDAQSINFVLYDGYSVNVPGFIKDVFGVDGSVEVIPKISVNIPTDALAQLIAGDFHDDALGSPGYRKDLVGPNQGNVQYFYNRWQEKFPFPIDFHRSGFLSNLNVQRNVNEFTYNGVAIQQQAEASTTRNADGSDQFHAPGDAPLDVLFGYSHLDVQLPSVDFGTLLNPKFPPDISGGSIGFTDTNVQNHASLPLDDYLQGEMKRLLDLLVPQPPTADAGADQSGDEGDTFSLDGSGSSDPNPNDTLTYSWTQLVGPHVTLSSSTAVAPSFIAPDNGTYRFRLTVSDGTTTASDVVEITIGNLPPEIQSLSAPAVGVRGQPLNFSVAWTDPGSADTHQVRWDFDDGTGVPFQGATSPATVSHGYAAKGTYDVTATVRDDDHLAVGNGLASASTTVTIKAAALLPDPADPTKLALFVGGTPNGDDIVLRRGAAPGQVTVVVNGTPEGTFSPTGRILVFGYDGSDKLSLDFSNGDFIPAAGLDYDGGAGSNTLSLDGGSFLGEVYTPSGPHAGTITLDGSRIGFTNLQPVDDTATVAFLLIKGTDSGETIHIVDHAGLVNGFRATQVNSGSGTFELMNFANKATVTVNALGGDDTIWLNNPNPGAGLTDLIIDTGAGSDTVNVRATAGSVSTTLTNGLGFRTERDTVNVGDFGSVGAILGAVAVENPVNLTDLNVDASADHTPRSITLSDSSLSGLAPAVIRYAGGDLGSLVVKAGDAGNTVTVTNTPSNQLGTLTTTLDTGTGNDDVRVLATSGPLTIDGQDGHDTVVLGSLAPNLGGTLANVRGAVTVTNTALFTALTLDDSGSSTAKNAVVTDGGVTGLAPVAIAYDDADLSSLAIHGGSGGNRFDLSGWTRRGSLDGGAGVNTLLLAKDVAQVALGDTRVTASDGMDVQLSHVAVANLTGGSSANTFDVSDWTGTGRVDGRGGSDTLVAAGDVNFTLTDGALARSGGHGTLNLSSLEVANLTGGQGDNTFIVGGWTGTGTLDGGPGGTDKVVAVRNSNFALSDALLTDTDGLRLVLRHIQAATLTGGVDPNTFVVSDWTGSAALDGGDNADTYFINLKGSGAGSTTIDDTGSAEADRLVVNGTGGDDGIVLGGTAVVRGAEIIHYRGIEIEQVNGNGGTDGFTINLTPDLTFRVLIDGGPSQAAALFVNDLADGAVVHAYRAGDTSGRLEARYQFGPLSSIEYRGVAQMVANPDANVSFVRALFFDVLGRNGTLAELSPFLKMLKRPGGRSAVVRRLEFSPEGRLHTAATWIERTLGRPATLAELRRFAAALKGQTEEAVLGRLLSSRAFASLATGGKVGYLQRLFERLLNRSATPREVKRLKGLFNTQGRFAVTQALLWGRDYRIQMLVDYYTRLLRSPFLLGVGPVPVNYKQFLPPQGQDQRDFRMELEAGAIFAYQG